MNPSLRSGRVRRRLTTLASAAACLAVTACVPDTLGQVPEGDPGTGGDPRSGDAGSGAADPGAAGDPVVGCTPEELRASALVAEANAPNVLMVVDHSGSMADPLATDGPSKWMVATGAIDDLLIVYGDLIRFGLATFPDADECLGDGGTILVPAGGGSDAISNQLAGLPQPDGGTPIAFTLDTVRENLAAAGLDDPERDAYVLLLSDGDESCSSSYRTEVALNDLAELGVRTAVLGFDLTGVNGNLNCYAYAGELYDTTACPDIDWTSCLIASGTCYYAANDLESLSAVLTEISSRVVECRYALEQPVDPGALEVFLDTASGLIPVARDPLHGWALDGGNNEVELRGDACAAVRNGLGHPLFTIGCPSD